MGKKSSSKNLTNEEIIELLVDIAYQQATRDCSGTVWFNYFVSKIDAITNGKKLEVS